MKHKIEGALILLFLFFSVFEKMHAQSWLWAKGIGGNSDDSGSSISVDPANGDVYSTGYFIGTVDFDPGPGTYFLTSSPESYSMFISKLDSSGNFVLAKAMTGTGTNSQDWSYGSSVSLDTVSESIYITGTFSGTIDFDPGPGIYNLSSPYYNGPKSGCCGGYNTAMCVVKLDTAGDFEWATAYGLGSLNGYDPGPDVYGSSITFDPSAEGNIFTVGYTAWIGYAFSAILISKIDSAGNFQWTNILEGFGSTWGSSITLDTIGFGGVYTTGSFEGTVDFDPGPGSYNITAAGITDIFISKLDYSGNFLWAKAIGGTEYELGSSIVANSISGAVYITGVFSGTVDFDPGPGTYFLTATGDNSNMFITKLDNAGNFAWAKAMIGIGDPGEFSHGSFIALDPAGGEDVYTTGYFGGVIDFDPGPGIFELTSGGYSDIFISKIDSSGNFVGATAVGGGMSDYSASLALNLSGNVYIAGEFNSSSITFGSITLTNEGLSDIFIAKFDGILPCTGIVTTINDSGSGSLRDIISCASSGSTITFSLAPLSQITLTSGEILINKNLTISAPGILDLTISGNNTSRIFHILPGKSLALDDLSLKNAAATINGGAIFVEGNLTLENVLLDNNFENGIPKGITVISPGGLVTIHGIVDIKY